MDLAESYHDREKENRTSAGPILLLMHNTALMPRAGTLKTIRHILDPGWHSSFWPNRYISPESAVVEFPRRTVVMLMEPARKHVNDQARLSSGGGNRNEKERHYERPRLTQKTSPRRIEPVRADQSGVLPFSHRCVSRVPEQSVPEFYPLLASPWQISSKPTACMSVIHRV